MKKYCCYLIFLFTLYLGAYNGYLALWHYGDSEPAQILPYHISSYPKIDQNSLEKGIKISSEEELTKLLDDFIS